MFHWNVESVKFSATFFGNLRQFYAALNLKLCPNFDKLYSEIFGKLRQLSVTFFDNLKQAMIDLFV